MVGGGSRIPAFIRMLSSTLGLEPARTLNSSECVAKGAGLSAAMSSGIFRIQPYYAVGQANNKVMVSWRGEGESIQNEANEAVLLEEGEQMYGKKSIELSLDTHNSNIIVSVHYEEVIDGLNQELFSFTLSFPLDETIKTNIRLNFELDHNHMLQFVTAFDLADQERKIIVEGLSPNILEAEKWIKTEMKHLQRDTQIIAGYESKNKFESHIYSLKEQLSAFQHSTDMAEFIEPSEL